MTSLAEAILIGQWLPAFAHQLGDRWTFVINKTPVLLSRDLCVDFSIASYFLVFAGKPLASYYLLLASKPLASYFSTPVLPLPFRPDCPRL